MQIKNTLPPYIDNINKAAADIAVNGVDNLEENFVNIIDNEAGFKANIKVIQTQSELLGTIIDLKA